MRVNVYSQELTDDAQLVSKRGRNQAGALERFYAVRLFLQSSPLLHDEPGDDDRSAVTLWLPRSAARRGALAATLRHMADLVESAEGAEA